MMMKSTDKSIILSLGSVFYRGWPNLMPQVVNLKYKTFLPYSTLYKQRHFIPAISCQYHAGIRFAMHAIIQGRFTYNAIDEC